MSEDWSQFGLIVFVKNAIPGKVKTRLAAEVGDVRAMDIYKKLVSRTREVVSGLHLSTFIYYSAFLAEDEWSSVIFEKRVQQGTDLGKRMSNAIRDILKEKQKVILIGSDCPTINQDHIKEAFNQLSTNQVVIGPSYDGGYYLIGMDNHYPTLFSGISWSTSSVLEQTMTIARDLHLRTALLKHEPDIDFASDWEEYGF